MLLVLLFSLLVRTLCGQQGSPLDIFWAKYDDSDGNLRVQMSLNMDTLKCSRSSLSTVCYLVDDDAPICGPFEGMVKSSSDGFVKTWVSLSFKNRKTRPPHYVTGILLDVDEKLVATSQVKRIVEETGEGVTMVLTLTRDDLDRSNILFRTLSTFLLGGGGIKRFVAVVPDPQVEKIRDNLPRTLGGDEVQVDVVGEGTLFVNYSNEWDKYALQMSIKLLVANIVETDFYVTLDADVVTVGSVGLEDFVREGRGNWVMEERNTHPNWWEGSGTLVGLPVDVNDEALMGDEKMGIGVTPAVMSTAGAMMAVGRIKAVAGGGGWEESWVGSFGAIWWSEYTTYKLVLDAYGVWNKLHERIGGIDVTCFNVWWKGDLPWKAEEIFKGDGGEEICEE
eukprot:CAMPEP_0118647660 /NCGR_PEP_ID=MMETSP0785-20121206/8731_1 /TAXON_ID=91992 /ORGANISM="Bolidomonas pacifica, Strain CCMP 1866" /LENGTH=392 /DNA_ID=CAMNT_0006539781 /DNA_START=80 /DNA_END=1255 /DNA_ORIENTATION=+